MHKGAVSSDNWDTDKYGPNTGSYAQGADSGGLGGSGTGQAGGYGGRSGREQFSSSGGQSEFEGNQDIASQGLGGSTLYGSRSADTDDFGSKPSQSEGYGGSDRSTRGSGAAGTGYGDDDNYGTTGSKPKAGDKILGKLPYMLQRLWLLTIFYFVGGLEKAAGKAMNKPGLEERGINRSVSYFVLFCIIC